MTLLPLRPQPEQMTGRAQRYLLIVCIRHAIIGSFCVLAPQTYKSSSFVPLREVLPLQIWGVVFLIASVVSGVAAFRRNRAWARLGLMMSATSTLVWAAGISMAWATGDLSAPSGPVVWWALAWKDFTVCEQPMRSPFETLVRAFREGETQRRLR